MEATTMPTTTQTAKEHSPTGDPDHVAHGSDYYWTCTCGASARFLTSQSKAEHKAGHHEQYCRHDGDVTVEVCK